MTHAPLFAVDVTSEIRSLCESQLRGTWQLPAELVRLAVRSGARQIAVTSGWRGFFLRWRGGPIAATTLESLATALDNAATSGRRQRSIAELESSGAEALLWAGGLAGARVRVVVATGRRQMRFTRRPGRKARVHYSEKTELSDEVFLRWTCPDLDRRRARAWLRQACRFSDAAVTVDRRPVARGFTGGLYQMRLDDPVPCLIGLTRRGHEPVLWLLRDGIVAGRAAVPGYPPFEAAVELGGVVSGAASGSDLRRAVTPFVSELCGRAVDMMIQVVGRPRATLGSEQQRLAALLLAAAQRGFRTEDIVDLALLPTFGEGADRLASLSRLEATARRRGNRWYAVDPEDRGAGVLADPAAVYVASAELRGLVVGLTGMRFQPPPRCRPGLWRRATDEAVRAIGPSLERLWGAVRPRIVDPAALSATERRVLGALRRAVSPATVEFGAGGRMLRTANGFIVPRFDPAVVAAGRSSDADQNWLFPLVLALKLEPSSRAPLRDRWMSALGSPPEHPPGSSTATGPGGAERS